VGKREPVDFSKINDPHLPACTLKMFLRELPDSLFTSTLTPEFNKISTISADQRSQSLNALIQLLPVVNRRVIHEVFALLRIVALNQVVNRMHERNLSIIFIPAFGISTDFFKLLLHEQDMFFSETTIASVHPESIATLRDYNDKRTVPPTTLSSVISIHITPSIPPDNQLNTPPDIRSICESGRDVNHENHPSRLPTTYIPHTRINNEQSIMPLSRSTPTPLITLSTTESMPISAQQTSQIIPPYSALVSSSLSHQSILKANSAPNMLFSREIPEGSLSTSKKRFIITEQEKTPQPTNPTARTLTSFVIIHNDDE